MKKTLMAAAMAALLGMGGAATAADLYSGGGLKDVPVAPPPLWTGFYVGAHMGIDWANLNLRRFDFEDGFGTTELGRKNLNFSNGFGGGQFGYNLQGGYFFGPNFVYGIEVDLGGVAMNGRENMLGETTFIDAAGVTHVGHIVALNMHNNGGFYGDVTGRLGYAWGSALVYAKGGFAFLQSNLRMREDMWNSAGVWSSFADNNNNDNFITGWTVGGGLEWKVSPVWSIKAEYLYFDFTDIKNDCCGDGLNTFNNNHNLTANTVKIGFNYFWNPPPAPLK